MRWHGTEGIVACHEYLCTPACRAEQVPTHLHHTDKAAPKPQRARITRRHAAQAPLYVLLAQRLL
jgi:hypothetical protein